jgi:hypothetical protein
VDGTNIIVVAMRSTGVRPYAAWALPPCSTRVIADVAGEGHDVHGQEVPAPRLHEHVGMTEVVRAAGLDWTIVRYIAPKDGPARSHVQEGFYGPDKLVNVTRATVGPFACGPGRPRTVTSGARTQ